MTHQNTFVLTRQPIHYIYYMVLLSRDRVLASPRADCSDYQPENTEQSLKSTTTIERHVLPITPMLSIQNAQKNRRSSERNFKNRPKNLLEKPSKPLKSL